MVKAQFDPEFERDPIRILVVDDEVLIRHVIAEELRDLGLVVIEAANADEAWSYLASGGPADLVFTDVRMPGSLSGAQLARRIRHDRPSLPVVVTSGGFDLSEWRESVLLKPYAPDETASHLAELARAARELGTTDDGKPPKHHSSD